MSGAFREGKTVTKINSGSDYFWPRIFLKRIERLVIGNWRLEIGDWKL